MTANPTTGELIALANRARSEAACPAVVVTSRELAKAWEAVAVTAAYAAMLSARIEALEARPRAGRPPKQKGQQQ